MNPPSPDPEPGPDLNRLAAALTDIYALLLTAYGPQHWWPADSPWEMAVGAVLTQNTNWNHAARAIANLKSAGCLECNAIASLDNATLACLLTPAGCHHLKAARLHNLCRWWLHSGPPGNRQTATADLRASLLQVNGIGPETADCILLYACQRPVFVIDAYTRRLCHHHFGTPAHIPYHTLQQIFHATLPADVSLFNEYHALLVACGKQHGRRQGCGPDCPLCAAGIGSPYHHSPEMQNAPAGPG